jgi:hypothetical protein
MSNFWSNFGENLFYFSLFCLFILILGISTLPDRKVREYYLVGDGTPISIGVDIDWNPDPRIPLVDVSYKEAITLIDSLNASLKRNR